MDFLFKVENNNIVFSSKEAEGRFRRLLTSFNNTGKTLSLHIEQHSRSTTERQLLLFRTMVGFGKDQTGMSFSEFESELLSRFAPKILASTMFDYPTTVCKKVEDMKQHEFREFLLQCAIFMKEFFNIDFQID